MKKAFLTAFIMFIAAFLLLFSFQKDKNRINSSGKKIYTSEVKRLKKPDAIKKTAVSAGAEQTVKPYAHQQQELPASVHNETLTAFFNEIPRIGQLEPFSAEELHGTPKAVLTAGEMLAGIHEYFFNHPQPRDVEMSFYLKCSQQKDFFDSIRAVCAARLSQQYFEATGHEISSEIFDKNIDQLRREINL